MEHYISYFSIAYPFEISCIFVARMPLSIAIFLNSSLPTSLPLHGVISLRLAMFPNHWQRQVVFFPSFTLLISFPSFCVPSTKSIDKSIRFSGVVRRWVVCSYPIRIQGRPHTHTYYILSAIACMYTPTHAIFPQTTLELLPW